MSSRPVPVCRTVEVFAFRGDRSRTFVAAFLDKLDDERNVRGPGPSDLDCLLLAGHAGVSTDGGAIIYGFNSDRKGGPVWQWMDGLKNGDALPGVVRDDTAAFLAAQNHGLVFEAFKVILPDPQFQDFLARLERERFPVFLWLPQRRRGLQLHHLAGTPGVAVVNRPHG